jgi:hypothetical protein
MPPMERATIHGEPDTVISSYAREDNATALVGDLSLRISDDGQCELIASIQVNLNIVQVNLVAEILRHQKPADMAGGYSLVFSGVAGAPCLSEPEPAKGVLWCCCYRSDI